MGERRYLGRGYEDVSGKPLGWAWHQERDAIRQHLRRRVWKFGLDGLAAMRLEARVDAIQRRLHRHKPSMRQRQAAWLARQPQAVPTPGFTADELQRLVELFAGANDPVTASIAAKAAAQLQAQT